MFERAHGCALDLLSSGKEIRLEAIEQITSLERDLRLALQVLKPEEAERSDRPAFNCVIPAADELFSLVSGAIQQIKTYLTNGTPKPFRQCAKARDALLYFYEPHLEVFKKLYPSPSSEEADLVEEVVEIQRALSVLKEKARHFEKRLRDRMASQDHSPPSGDTSSSGASSLVH
jgi:hypothetical protein